jgi:sugar phosphate isomerase/epimerase
MRIGVEGDHIAEARRRGGIGALRFAHEHGLDGVFFKSVLDLSPSLDGGELRSARAYADEMGLYLEVGIGRVNPYNTAESPHIRELGDGDYRLGIERLIRASRAIDCTELWAETGTYKRHLPGYFVFDRFRTDVAWTDQLEATRRFLSHLAPLLHDLGCRIDVETHEEITSFELVRLVEAVGPDVLGITFDTANVLARAEDPLEAARRVAPYTHLTHAKDAIVYFVDGGLEWQARPCGAGVIDWDTLIGILADYSPNLHLSLEDNNGCMPIPIFLPTWQMQHPDLSVRELAEVVRLARTCEERVARGAIPSPAVFRSMESQDRMVDNMRLSLNHLRGILTARGLDGAAVLEQAEEHRR